MEKTGIYYLIETHIDCDSLYQIPYIYACEIRSTSEFGWYYDCHQEHFLVEFVGLWFLLRLEFGIVFCCGWFLMQNGAFFYGQVPWPRVRRIPFLKLLESHSDTRYGHQLPIYSSSDHHQSQNYGQFSGSETWHANLFPENRPQSNRGSRPTHIV